MRSRTPAARAASSSGARRPRSRIVAKTRQPRRARVTVVSRPKPLDAPVMSAVLATRQFYRRGTTAAYWIREQLQRSMKMQRAWHTFRHAFQSYSLGSYRLWAREAAESFRTDSRRDCRLWHAQALPEVAPEQGHFRMASHGRDDPERTSAQTRLACLGRTDLHLLRGRVSLRDARP